MHSKLKDRYKEEFLENLNSEQKKAVMHFQGPLLVYAGAGSGKTKVITHRISYLIRIYDVFPEEIVAVTFTNKAAEEMKSRVQNLIGPYSEKMIIKTFHSLGLQILRENYKLLHLNSNFSVYDVSSQKSLAKKIFKEFNIKEDAISSTEFLQKICSARDELLEPEDLSIKYKNYPFLDLLYDFYKKYIQELRNNNAVDFSDLLFESVKIFKEYPEILERYQKRWQFLMIDEYQDTNYVQYVLAKLITNKTKNLAVVGDDDQSIYSWRGARVENILNFHKDFPETVIIKLEENYRSTNQILELANRVISKNQFRKPKKLFSKKTQGEEPKLFEFSNEYEEAEFVIQEIKKNSTSVPLNEIAIFYRTNAQSRIFEERLRANQIPYRIYGGFKFYERKEIKDLLSYLQFINNPKDFNALERMIETPSKGIGEKTIWQIKEYSEEKKVDYLTAIQDLIEFSKLKTKLKDFHQKLRNWIEISKGSIYQLLQNIIRDTQLISYYEKNLDPENLSKIENIKEFLNSVLEYEERKKQKEEKIDLSIYLQEIALLTNEDSLDIEKQESVNLMTLHNAKGLEFQVVFLTGLEEGILPHVFSLEEEKVEEERRLLYVGITRAKEKLYLTYCLERKRFSAYEALRPSRFIEEMQLNSECMFKKATRLSIDKKFVTVDYKIYEKYFHPMFGVGILTKIEESEVGKILWIDFGKKGIKSFLANSTTLKKI